MSDLIDRQKAIDDIEECAEIANRNYEYDREQGLLQAREILIEAQPVQPEIIRCKDCVHHGYEGRFPYCDIKDYGYGWEDDDFCSDAERRADE